MKYNVAQRVSDIELWMYKKRFVERGICPIAELHLLRLTLIS